MKLLFYKIRLLVILSASVTSLGCSTIGQIKNEPISGKNDTELTSGTLFSAARAGNPKGITLILAFSGGGTRASALSYGVLEELRDTNVTIGGKSTRLLDEVDFISSVSGCNPPGKSEQLLVENSAKLKQRSFLCANHDTQTVRSWRY